MNAHFSLRAVLATVLFLVAAASVADADAERVNVNTADAETIAAVLVGVGLSRAEAIVEYRDRNGRFNDLSELTRVRGIGAATVEKNAERITLSSRE